MTAFIALFQEYQVYRNMIVEAPDKREARRILKQRRPAAVCISCKQTVAQRKKAGMDLEALGYKDGDELAAIHTWS